MTITSIPDNDRKERFIATAGQTIFPFDFPIFAATDLQVKRERAGVESTLILGTDYTLTGAGEQAGGNITLTAGAQLNDIIVLLSAMPSGRTTQYVNGGDLPAAALESDFARLQILLQQILRDARAGLLYPSTDGPMPDLPPIASRAGRFLAFDAQGQPYAAGAPGTALDAVARAGDTMTGPLRIAAGSAAAPGLTPAGDPNTGIFAPAADEIGISLNGQEVARFNSNGLVGRLVPRTWLDVASATTIDLGAQNADSLRVTGTTGISGLGTAPSGTRRRLRFAGVLTITHSAALICPGAANIITAAGDIADVESLGAGNWVITAFQRAANLPFLNSMATARVLGRLGAGSGPIETISLANPAPGLSLGIARGTEQATTSGTAIDFTGIPAGVRRLTALLNGVSTNGTANLALRLGTSGGFVASGYEGISGYWGSVSAVYTPLSTSFFTQSGTASAITIGRLLLENISGNVWLGTFTGTVESGGARWVSYCSGVVSLSDALTQLRLTTDTGTSIFDAGTMNIMWEF